MAKRRDLLKLAGFPALSAMAAGAAPQLPNATLSAAQASLTREPFGEHRVYFSGATRQVKSMAAGSVLLKPGMSPHPPHEHADEEFMVVTEGSGEITLEGKAAKVGPGSMMYCAAGRSHGILNTGKTPLLFYYYKWQA